MAGHADGTLYFAGEATSEAPITAGSLQTELRGPRDLYLLRLASDGSRPIFATYYGGSGQESAHSIVFNPNGEA
jgi:hypothetical protein